MKPCPTKLSKLTTLVISSLFFLLSFQPAHAEFKLIVSPPKIDIDAEPGEIIQKTIKVTNQSDTPLTLRALIIDYIVQDDLGTPIQVSQEAAGRYLASPWMNPDTNSFNLEPNNSYVLNVLVQIPNDALPGGHYAGVFFEPTTTLAIGQTASQVVPQVGSIFAINIAGDVNYDALIKEFKTKQRVYEYGPVEFSAILENQSDTHIRPITSIAISNMLGKEVATLDFEGTNIFPFASRVLESQWDQTWGLGKYKATLTAAYGPQGDVINSTIFFWMLPYKIIIAVIVIILVLVATFISIRRHLQHRNDNRDDTIDQLKRRIVDLENKKK